MEILSITRGHPFEHEWSIDYDIFGDDKVDSTIPFIIKNENMSLELEFNYGLSIIKFDNDPSAKIVVSIYETDILEDGEYECSYNPKTFSGKEIANITGKISVSSNMSDQLPEMKRPVRPWDLLRSKKSEQGERATEEERNSRLSICKECPRYVKATSQCLECGCIMKLKTKLSAATCPLGKW